jgi:class 3 adenylate cyclase
MRSFLSGLVNAGTAGLSPRDLKHVRLTNQMTLVAILTSVFALVDPRMLANSWLRWFGAAAVFVNLSALVISSLRFHRTARTWLAFGNIAWVTAAGLLMGVDAEGHLFLIAVATSAWFMVPKEQRGFAVLTAAVSMLCLLAVEFFAPARVAARPEAVLGVALDKMTLLLILQALAYYAVTQTERAEAKSEALLLNILPRRIAEQLMLEDRAVPERFEAVTVLFADLVNFTQLSERTSPTELVKMLDEIFTHFDALADKHGLEKIKTIGDAYMVVGGLPEPGNDSASRVARMALDMQNVLTELDAARFGGLAIRIGIHSGPVVAGVIGKRKFAYDLWGDSVNTASRMESHGQPGRIHVTQVVREQLGEKFEFEARGAVSVKGKGELTTFFLVRER